MNPSQMFAAAFNDRTEIDRLDAIVTKAVDWFESEPAVKNMRPPSWVTDARTALGRKPHS